MRLLPMKWTSWLSVLLVLLAGCGGSGPYRTVKVTGTFTYDDGSVIPAHRIEVKFISQEPPQDASTHPRPGLVDINVADGSFSDVSTYEYGDGVIRGKHIVTAMSLDAGNIPTKHIPELYYSSDTSPLRADTAQVPFKLTIPKPK